MSDDYDRSWLTPGAKVTRICTGGWTARVVGEGVVAKVGKRDVVLESGQRFRLSDLHEQGRSRTYADQIVRPDDPRVQEIHHATEAQRLKNAATAAVNMWQQDRDDEERTLTAIDALIATLSDEARSLL